MGLGKTLNCVDHKSNRYRMYFALLKPAVPLEKGRESVNEQGLVSHSPHRQTMDCIA